MLWEQNHKNKHKTNHYKTYPKMKKQASNHYACNVWWNEERFLKSMKNKKNSSSHLAGRLVGWLAPDTQNAIKLTYVMIGQQKHKKPLKTKLKIKQNIPQQFIQAYLRNDFAAKAQTHHYKTKPKMKHKPQQFI